MHMHPVTCRDCGNEVLVCKLSHRHTSVQWRGGSDQACAWFQIAAAAAERSGGGHSCRSLQASIDQAVADGRLPVPDDEDGHGFAGIGSPEEAATRPRPH